MICTSELVDPRLAQAGRVWLFLDYDGTLADFAPTPEHVQPDPAVVDLLSRFVDEPRIRMAVVSGRRLSHVRSLLPVPGVLLAGTYGIELQTPEGERIDRLAYETIRPALDALKPRWGAGTEFRSIRWKQYKYVVFRNAPPLFFDLADDPGEQRNLIVRGAKGEARAALEHLARVARESIDFDAAERERVEAELEREVGLEPGEVIVYCPAPEMSLKEADILVDVGPHGVCSLKDLTPTGQRATPTEDKGGWPSRGRSRQASSPP